MEIQSHFSRYEFDLLAVAFQQIKEQNDGIVSKYNLAKNVLEKVSIGNICEKPCLSVFFKVKLLFSFTLEDVLDSIEKELFISKAEGG